MARKPLTVNSGQIEQLASGEPLDVGGWNLPSSGGTEDYVLMADDSGHAVWSPTLALTALTVDNITIDGAVISSDTGAISFSNENLTTTGTVVGSNIPSPTVDDQVLISTAAGTAGWSTAGNNQYLASNGSGEVAWTDKSEFAEADTLDTVADRGATTDQTLTAGGFATLGSIYAGWFSVDNITMNVNTISGSPTLYISPELIVLGVSESRMYTGGVFRTYHDDVSLSDTEVVGSFEFYTNDGSPASAGLCGAMRYTSDGTWWYTNLEGHLGFFTQDKDAEGGTLIERMTINNLGDVEILDGGDLTTTGTVSVGQLTVDNITFNAATITSNTGAISFGDEDLTTTGTVVGSNIPSPTVDDQVLISTAAGIAGWSTAGNDQVLASDGSGEVAWLDKTSLVAEADTLDTVADRGDTTDQTLTAGGFTTTGTVTAGYLTVDNITIDAAIITSDTGAISFSDENLSTTGTVVGSNVPSPTVDDQVLISTAAGVAGWSTAGNDQYLASDGSGEVAWVAKPTLASNPTADDQVLISTAADAASWSTAGNNQYLASNGSGEVAWTDKSELAEADTLDTVADRGATTDQTLTAGGFTTTGTVSAGQLTVDNITIDAAIITSDTGAISFSNENLSTTGTVVGSNVPSPSVDDQVLISTGDKVAAWSTAGNNQYLASNGSGEVAWTDKSELAEADTLDTVADRGATTDQTLTAGGFTTTGTVSAGQLTVDNITIDAAIITSDTGAISFSNENLSTTGTITSGDITSGSLTTTGSNIYCYNNVALYTGGSDITGTCIIDLPVAFVSTMLSIKLRGYHYGNSMGPWEVLLGGYLYTADADIWYNHRASVRGRTPFTSIRLGYNGNTGKACIMLGTTSTSWKYPKIQIANVLAGHAGFTSYGSGWAISFTTDETNFYNNDVTHHDPVTTVWNQDFNAPSVDDQVLISTGDKVAAWSTAGNNQYLASNGSGEVAWTDKSELAEADTLDTVADRGATTDQTLTAGGLSTTGTVLAAHAKLTQGIKHDHGDGAKTYSNVFSKYASGYITGTCVIDLPVDCNNTMLGIKLRGYNFSDETAAWESFIGGLADYVPAGPDGWLHCRATVSGEVLFTQIRLGYNGNTNKACIMLGSTSTNWTHTVIQVADVIAGLDGQDGYETGWDINWYTDETNFYNNDATQDDPVTIEWNRDFNAPSVDDQVLISTGDKVAAWSTAGNNQYLASNGLGEVAWTDKVWTSTLTENQTIYVKTTGNDTTGDGSVGTPYLTLAKVIEVVGKLYIGDYTVTVDIGEGVFTEAGTISFMHPFGSQVTFQGVSERIASLTTASISGTTSYGFDNLYYRDVTMVLPVGKSVSVGDYIGFSSASSGLNPNAIVGVHRVSAWDSGTRTATVEVAYRDGSESPSGFITCNVDLIKTVIAFTNKNGLKISGPYQGGLWKGLVIQGSWDGSNDALYGIWALNTAVVALSGEDTSGYACGIVGFKTAVYVQNNALVFADYVFMSKHGQHICKAQNGGILNLRYARLSACNNYGIYAFNGSTVAATGCTVVGTGDNSVVSYQGSFIDLSSAFVGESASTTSVYADFWSGIDGTGATVDDAISPATDGNNDGSYVIGL